MNRLLEVRNAIESKLNKFNHRVFTCYDDNQPHMVKGEAVSEELCGRVVDGIHYRCQAHMDEIEILRKPLRALHEEYVNLLEGQARCAPLEEGAHIRVLV